MLEGSRCPYKCGRGPSFSYPSKIPFLSRQLNRSQNKLNTIKLSTSASLFLQAQSYAIAIDIIFCLSTLKTQRDIPTLHTEMRTRGVATRTHGTHAHP